MHQVGRVKGPSRWRARTAAVFVAAVLATAGCGSSDSPDHGTTAPSGASTTTAAPTSGGATTTSRGGPMTETGTVRGIVSAGPLRGAQRPGEPDTAPVTNGRVVAHDRDDASVGSAAIGSDGRYQLELRPGAYTLIPTDTGIMRCPGVSVEITAGATTVLDLTCDTGIR